jgi:hypothetical protein
VATIGNAVDVASGVGVRVAVFVAAGEGLWGAVAVDGGVAAPVGVALFAPDVLVAIADVPVGVDEGSGVLVAVDGAAPVEVSVAVVIWADSRGAAASVVRQTAAATDRSLRRPTSILPPPLRATSAELVTDCLEGQLSFSPICP